MREPGTSRFFWIRIRVNWVDTDAAGVVWFGNFLRFFEESEDELFRALGRSRLDLVEEFDVLMPRVDMTCRFRSPARFGDELKIGIAVEEVAERRIAYRFEARHAETGQLVAEGAYRVACVTRRGFQATAFPPAFRQLLERVDAVADPAASDPARTP